MGKDLCWVDISNLKCRTIWTRIRSKDDLESLRLLKKLQTIEPERGDLGPQLSFWFTTLDDAVQHAGAKITDVKLPLEYFAALLFLGLDGASPYYRNASVADETELVLDVAQVLHSTRTAAFGMLQACVEMGGPVCAGRPLDPNAALSLSEQETAGQPIK